MATTTNGFRYPVATDTPNVPQDIQNLASDVDTKTVLKTGSTMTGNLTLPGEPSSTNHAATKGYVDKFYRPRWLSYSPSNWQYTTTGTRVAWYYDIPAPFATGSWILHATYCAPIRTFDRLDMSLRTYVYGASSTLRKETLSVLNPASGGNYGQYTPVSLFLQDVLPASTGARVALYLNVVNGDSGVVEYANNWTGLQRLEITGFPTLQGPGGSWV